MISRTEAPASRRIPPADWKWFGNAGHFICAQWCRFHLCTLIGDYLVSTVGQYWPDADVRRIHASVHDRDWLADHSHLKGDDFDAAYAKRFGYEDIGFGRKFETMVFKTTGEVCDIAECGCGMPTIVPSELDSSSYNDAGSATAGHYAMCEKVAAGEIEEPEE